MLLIKGAQFASGRLTAFAISGRQGSDWTGCGRALPAEPSPSQTGLGRSGATIGGMGGYQLVVVNFSVSHLHLGDSRSVCCGEKLRRFPWREICLNVVLEYHRVCTAISSLTTSWQEMPRLIVARPNSGSTRANVVEDHDCFFDDCTGACLS